jgi:uncharacterized protein (TIGR02271 family)
MALHKIKDFYPDYKQQFGEHDVTGYSFYEGDNKIGSVDDLLVDDEGRFRYLVINTGAWIFGKKVLLPIGRARIEYGDRRVYSDGLTREQVEALPEYDPNAAPDYDYEERVRGVYRPANVTNQATTDVAGLGTAAGMADAAELNRGTNTRPNMTEPGFDRPVDSSRALDADVQSPVEAHRQLFDRNSYSYEREPHLFKRDDSDTLRLYEERLIAGKARQKTGEVTVGKRIETETQHVSVPVEKERVVIERVNPTDVTPVGAEAFQEGEVVRMEVYEETPEIRKEAFVREEVRVRKEVDRDTIESDETIRKERLDVNTDGNPDVRK